MTRYWFVNSVKTELVFSARLLRSDKTLCTDHVTRSLKFLKTGVSLITPKRNAKWQWSSDTQSTSQAAVGALQLIRQQFALPRYAALRDVFAGVFGMYLKL
jgi:hypothetical protein